MADEQKIPTWGYSKAGDKVFDLKPGESLPDGYFAHPAMIRGSAADKQMRADAEAEGVASHQFEAAEPRPATGGSQRR